jgi:hypothetical protein
MGKLQGKLNGDSLLDAWTVVMIGSETADLGAKGPNATRAGGGRPQAKAQALGPYM